MSKLLSRFFFLFFIVFISPWWYLYDIPGAAYLLDFFHLGEVWIVEFFNKYFFRIKDTLNQNGGGSGDTSFAWAQFYTFIFLSVLGSLIWTFIDRKREKNYNTLNFWLRNIIRYHLAIVSLSYGIHKLFALQMPFPNLSQLATPLGDFLPMRLSWMFIGYSTPYQIFSGVMETIVGLLLLNRKTVTTGVLLGIGVFANVFMLNLCYDIPVKQYSMLLLICCLFLAAYDGKRLLNFFWLNQHVQPSTLYEIVLEKRWQKISRIVFKVVFILLFVSMPLVQSWKMFEEVTRNGELKPIKAGIYNIETFVKNQDTITISDDKMMWKDFIFDKGGTGSINTMDTLFRQRYNRGYFVYEPDTISQTIKFKKQISDTTNLFVLNYKITDDSTLTLWGKLKSDSLYFKLNKNNRHFQLSERQFHWISEANR